MGPGEPGVITVPYQGDGCMVVPEGTETCADPEEVNPEDLFAPWTCDVEVTSVQGEGTTTTVTYQNSESDFVCCYPVIGNDRAPNCVIGRPYFDGGSARLAPVCDQTTGAEVAAQDIAPGDVAAQRARAWALAGAGEHASVAAFGRLALQLMACGAPTYLLGAVHQAALDEVRHAEACWGLATHLGQENEVAAGAFPFTDSVDTRANLAELAASTAREGCLAETLGAHLAVVAAERATEPEVKRVLGVLADDESRHAVLSFQIVAWALQAGGAEVRAAVEAALAQPWPQVDVDELALRSGIARSELMRSAREGVDGIILPAVRQLLATAA